MGIIERIATYLAISIRQNDPNAKSEAVLKFALIIAINTFITVFLVLFIGFVTQHLIDSIVVLFSFMFLRYFSGGAHLNSSMSCTIASAVILTLLTLIQVDYYYIGITLNILALVIVFIKAPSGIEKVRKVSSKHISMLKYVSLLIVFSNFLIKSPLLSTVFFIQAVTLFSIVDKTITYFERSSVK